MVLQFLPDTGLAHSKLPAHGRRSVRAARARHRPTLDRGPLVVRRSSTRRCRGSRPLARACACGGFPRSRTQRLHRASRALVERIGLELDTAASPGLERMAQHQELRLDVDAGAPGGRMRATSSRSRRRVLRPEGEEPGRADDARRADGRERELDVPAERPSASSIQARAPSRVDGCTIGSHSRFAGRATPPRAVGVCRRAARAGRRGPRASVRTTRVKAAAYTAAVPIYEYACMECEEHFDELVRPERAGRHLSECGAAKVLRQLSAFAVPAGVEAELHAGRRRRRGLLRRRLRLRSLSRWHTRIKTAELALTASARERAPPLRKACSRPGDGGSAPRSTN